MSAEESAWAAAATVVSAAAMVSNIFFITRGLCYLSFLYVLPYNQRLRLKYNKVTATEKSINPIENK